MGGDRPFEVICLFFVFQLPDVFGGCFMLGVALLEGVFCLADVFVQLSDDCRVA